MPPAFGFRLFGPVVPDVAAVVGETVEVVAQKVLAR